MILPDCFDFAAIYLSADQFSTDCFGESKIAIKFPKSY